MNIKMNSELMDMRLDLIVLVKQVPDIEKVRFDIERGRIDRSSADAEVNPFDLNALEAAIRIREEHGGKITAVSMGPAQAESALRDTLARGADKAILLTDRRFAGADTLATSYTLASAIKKIGSFDLILCGEKTVDGDTGQVGPEVAQQLGIPHVSYVSEIKNLSKEKILVRSDMSGYYYLIESELPALITVTKDINEPRLPSLRDRLKARKAEVEHWTAKDLTDVADVSRFGFQGSPTTVSRISIPSEAGRIGKFFRGKTGKVVEELVEEVFEKKIVKV